MSFFNIVNPRIAELLGTPIIPHSVQDQSLWGGVTTTNLHAWNSALHDTYIALYFAGYKPTVAQFRVTGTHVVRLELDTGSLSTIADGDSPDIVLSFETIAASLPGWNRSDVISIPLSGDIDPELAGYQEFATDFIPTLSIQNNLGTITMRVFGLMMDFDGDGEAEAATYPDRSHPDYAGEGILPTTDVVRDHIERAVYNRWFEAEDPDDRDPEGRDNWAVDEVHVAAEGVTAKPLDDFADDVNGEALPGLLWVFNPDVWGFSPGVEPPKRLTRIASRIWQRFLDIGLSTPRRTGHEGKTQMTMPIWGYSALARRTLGMHKVRGRRFMDEIDALIAASGVEFSETLRLGLRSMPYLEVIMVLVNFGVIRIAGLGDFVLSDTDEDRDPVEFYRISGARDGIDITLFGAAAVELTYETTLHDYRSDPSGATPYTLEKLVAWEFHECTIETGFDPIENEAPTHRLVIVAAPGVRVTTSDVVGVEYQVIRVQDPLFVPRMFTQIDTGLLLSPYQVLSLPPGEVLEPDVAEVLAEPIEEDIRDGGDTGFPGDDVIEDTGGGGDGGGDPLLPDLQSPTDSGEIEAFTIRPEEDGVTIEYPSAKFAFADLDIEYFSLKIKIKVDKTAPDQKFSFDIRPTAAMQDILDAGEVPDGFDFAVFQQFELVIHKTHGVEVELSTCNPARKTLIGHREEYERYDWVRFFIYDVVAGSGADMLNCVQPPDADLSNDVSHRTSIWSGQAPGETNGYLPDAVSDYVFGPPLTPIQNYRQTPTQSVPHGQLQFVGLEPGKFTNLDSPGFFVRLLFDVGIGFVPVVGTASDIAELVLVMSTGRDRWGDPVSNTQFLLMIGCTALPLVSTGAAKALARGAL